jgi:hypothetical protein
MKINEVTEAGMETDPKHKKLANIGRALMTYSETAPMKGKTDAEVGVFNQMSNLGNNLTKFGTIFGPRSLQDLMKSTNLNAETIKKMMAFGEKLAAKGVASKVADPEPEDEPEDDFGGPDDDEVARQADRAARGR